MHHVRTYVEQIPKALSENQALQMIDLNGFMYILDHHFNKFILGMKDRDTVLEQANPSIEPITFFTPKDRFLARGESNVDLMDSCFMLFDEATLISKISSLRKRAVYKDKVFYSFKIQESNTSDGSIYYHLTQTYQP